MMASMDAMSMQALSLDEQPFTYQNLLHELLMALLGYTGDVFVDANDTGCACRMQSHAFIL